jgi:dihydrofolate reductase
MRELKYYVACTVDGFISREDGSFDFFPTEGDYLQALVESFPETIPSHLREVLGVRSANKWFDAVLMGRNTYEVGLKMGFSNPYPQMKQYLFSHTMTQSPDVNVELVSGDALSAVRQLKKEAGKDIWLCGGGKLAAALFSEIDELILKVNPIVLGSGIPLFSGTVKHTDLTLADSTRHNSGVLINRYRVKHGGE